MAPLDEFMPLFDVRERFSVVVRAPADVVFETACAFDMQSLWPVKAILWMRSAMLGSTPRERPATGLVDETVALGWGILRREPGRLVVAGAICQPWLADVRFRPIPPGEFAARLEPDHVKIVWTLEAEPVDARTTRLSNETRVVGTDEGARRRFLRYWRWARVGIVGIRLILLPGVRRAAEARARSLER